MVDYKDPAVIAQDNLAMFGFWHAMAGLYFWEYVSTLGYEWSVIRGHRPFRWTMWIYSTMRISTLALVILALVILNVGDRYNCKLEVVSIFFFAYLALVCASSLIVLRIVAIWNKKRIIMAIAGGAWGINLIFQIQAIVRFRAKRVFGYSCVVPNLHISLLNVLVTLATDIVLLFIMFFGLLRLGFHERSAFGLGRLLWRQGVIWLLVATIAEVPPAVFLCLNLNDPFNRMFLPPSMVTLTIAATRIHRSLVEHASYSCTNQERSGRLEWGAYRVPIAQTCVEVTIDRTSDEDHTPQTSRNGSVICIGEQLYEKVDEQRGLDESAEIDVTCQRQAPL